MDIPIADVLLVNIIDVAQGILEHDNPSEVIADMMTDTGNAIIDSFLVTFLWIAAEPEKLALFGFERAASILSKIKSSIIMSWIGKTALGMGIYQLLDDAEDSLDMKAVMSQSKVLQQANHFMGVVSDPGQLNWMHLYGESEVQIIHHEGTISAMNAIGE